MRSHKLVLLVVALACAACAQSITEVGVAAAGGTVGGAAGKKVSDGLSAVFGKVDDQTKAAAKQDPGKKAAPAPPKQEQAQKDQANTGKSDVGNSSSPGPSFSPGLAPSSSAASSSAPSTPAHSAKGKARKSAPREARETPKPAISGVPDPPPVPSRAAAIRATEPPPPVLPVLAPIPAPPPPLPPVVTAKDLQSISSGETREDLLKLGSPASRITMLEDGHLLEIYSYAANNATFGVVRLSDGAVSRVELR